MCQPNKAPTNENLSFSMVNFAKQTHVNFRVARVKFFLFKSLKPDRLRLPQLSQDRLKEDRLTRRQREKLVCSLSLSLSLSLSVLTANRKAAIHAGHSKCSRHHDGTGGRRSCLGHDKDRKYTTRDRYNAITGPYPPV